MTTSSSAEVPEQVASRPAGSRVTGDMATTSLVRERPPSKAWAGYLLFAAWMLVVIGSFSLINGLVAIFKDGYYAVPSRDLIVSVDYTAWGWVHLALGVVAIATGAGIMIGKTWARFLGVGYAVVNAVINLSFLKAFPLWSALLIGFDILVIWALCVHGDELAE
jgi:hypothetical protein